MSDEKIVIHEGLVVRPGDTVLVSVPSASNIDSYIKRLEEAVPGVSFVVVFANSLAVKRAEVEDSNP